MCQQKCLIISGLVLATIGMDPVSGWVRYAFGSLKLSQGISFPPVVMGLFGIGEMLYIAEQGRGLPQARKVKLRELFPNLSEWRRSWAPILRGGVLGFFWGLIPGPAPILASFTSYKIEKRLSKHQDEFGHGAIEGVAGPESANNAAAEGAPVLLATVLLLCLVGAYSINNSLLDVAVLIVMGGVGYLFNKLKFDPAPIAVAMVLGPVLESALRQSLRISGGDPLIFIQRPISAFFIGALAFVAVVPTVWRFVAKRQR